MTDETVDLVTRFRGEAAARGLPPDTVEYWIRSARPAMYLAEGGEGPLAAQFGGDPLLPDGAPEPYGSFVAAVDCALLPPNATGLPLPPDGQLLFFADADAVTDGTWPGLVTYVPPGTPTARRPVGTPRTNGGSCARSGTSCHGPTDQRATTTTGA
jgi:hypothetical protein